MRAWPESKEVEPGVEPDFLYSGTLILAQPRLGGVKEEDIQEEAAVDTFWVTLQHHIHNHGCTKVNTANIGSIKKHFCPQDIAQIGQTTVDSRKRV
jgi:hypothetical protein